MTKNSELREFLARWVLEFGLDTVDKSIYDNEWYTTGGTPSYRELETRGLLHRTGSIGPRRFTVSEAGLAFLKGDDIE
jgi:hypothetical protein